MEMDMPFGATVTTHIADLFPDDPLAPQVVGDFAQALPPNPIKGDAVSHFADSVFPTDPTHSSDIGLQLSAFIQILVQPDVSIGIDLSY